ncbi:oxygenase MpaB family protein [Aerosakkonemataceae cyanobacterium BLCC-F154]|uniref:Oxygenase MpaB family protein n=1 Tax=Floridaenema fluviatile BLCC-F154 TaxID=3153640 RepID=A0ABV4Y7L5_9CYAN
MGRYDNFRKIEQLDPVKDHSEIVNIMVSYEFPWDFQRSYIELAFVRAFASPRMAGLVASRGYAQAHTQRRYDDTAILLFEMIKHGYDSEEGRACIERMNYIHGHFRINNQDFIYITAALILEPIYWIDRFGWRRMSEKERCAWLNFWLEIAKRMKIKDLPDSLEEMERFKQEYEDKFVYNSPATKELYHLFVGLISSWFPLVPRGLVELVFRCILDERSLKAFELKAPPVAIKKLVEICLHTRAWVLSFLPARTKSGLFVDRPSLSYPANNYDVTKLGPSDENLKKKISG